MDDATLTEALAELREEDGVYSAPVPRNWAQERTAYGGYSATLLLASARRAYPDLPPLRSTMVNFTGPISEAPEITVTLLRQGRNISTLRVVATTGGKTAATAVFSFGVAQDSHVSATCPAPEASPPEETESFFPEGMPKLPIGFFNNFEVRLIEGHRPFMGGDRGYVRVWARHRDEAIRGTPEGLLSIADVLPPAAFSLCKKMGPNSSVNWICNVLSEDLTTKDGWWMIESALSAGHDGYSSQVMRMWNSEGELVVDGMQSVVIFV